MVIYIFSDGVGRTGTYCLIDMVLNRMAKGNCHSVFENVLLTQKKGSFHDNVSQTPPTPLGIVAMN